MSKNPNQHISPFPFEECRSCPRHTNCPLKSYIRPCVFKGIYLAQEREDRRLPDLSLQAWGMLR